MFDKVKNFVTNPENVATAKAAVISTVVTVATGLAIQVVVLGISTAVQAIANAISEPKQEE